MIATFPGILRKVFAFNAAERDVWVAHRAAEVPAGARVLDVGAGSCPYRPFFVHCEYRAHDFARLAGDQLRSGYGYGTLDYVSDILSIPVESGSFDVILCTEVLEHLPEPIEALREFARILCPGGRLLLTAPLGSGLHQEPYHFYGGYTPHWYRRFLTATGFEGITIEANGGFFKHYGQESVRFAKLLKPSRNVLTWLWAPLWLLSLPWFVLLMPALGYAIDSFDKQRAFTVGYHVTAVRQG